MSLYSPLLTLKPHVVGEGRIEQAERVRELQLPEDGNLLALTKADGGGGPFPHAVQGEDGRLREGRRIEGAGRMGQVVLREEQRRRTGAHLGQFLPEERAHQQLFLDPHRHGHEKARQSPGRKAVVGLQQALELEIGLVVKGHRGKIAELEPRLRHDVGQGLGRKVGVVLLAGEALFLGRGDDLAVHQDGCGAVVIKGGKPENGVRQGSGSP